MLLLALHAAIARDFAPTAGPVHGDSGDGALRSAAVGAGSEGGRCYRRRSHFHLLIEGGQPLAYVMQVRTMLARVGVCEHWCGVHAVHPVVTEKLVDRSGAE